MLTRKKVFVSYRRVDTGAFSTLILRSLNDYLGAENVFVDTHSISVGEDFNRRIMHEIDAAQVVVVLIGKNWLELLRKQATEQSTDWVRVEVATALKLKKEVIPVLVDGACPLASADVPNDISEICNLNAAEVRQTRLDADVFDLTGRVVEIMGRTWPPVAEPSAAKYSAVAIIYAIAIALLTSLAVIVGLFAKTIDTKAEVPLETLIGYIILVSNVVIILKLPIHRSLPNLSKRMALRTGAILHMVAILMFESRGEFDIIQFFVAALMPSLILWFSSTGATNARPKLK